LNEGVGRSFKVAGVQMASVQERDKNLAKAATLVHLAAGEGAGIVALPQLFNTPWFPSAIDPAGFGLAEREDGPTISSVRELASRHGVTIIASIFEEDSGSYFNTAFVIGADGSVSGRYRKIHVPQLPLWEERAYFSPGDLGFPVFKTPLANIGVQLCWDVFFPEGFRTLALKGADVVFCPTASAFYHSHKKWERAIGAAAHANGMFIVRINRVGREPHQEFYGRSFAVGPDGEFITTPSGASDGVVMADIDLAEIAGVRNEWVFLKDRRPAEYGAVTEEER
jgi:N-carbamoylputrescine amidase